MKKIIFALLALCQVAAQAQVAGGGSGDPDPTSGQSVSRKFRNFRIVK